MVIEIFVTHGQSVDALFEQGDPRERCEFFCVFPQLRMHPSRIVRRISGVITSNHSQNTGLSRRLHEMKGSGLRTTLSTFLAIGIPALVVASLVVALTTAAQASSGEAPLRMVPHVDLKRYMGDWRVISEIPYFAEKDCVDSIESYGLRADGTIDNWFTYRKKTFDAPRKKLTAHAVVVNKKTNAEWRVRFFAGLISAKYLVIDLDPNYQWTVVGHPSRNYGWIMAREKTLSKSAYHAILNRLTAQGYDISRFKMTPQFPSHLGARAPH